jgi:drug/metabolite transporter (DMT)-like permease
MITFLGLPIAAIFLGEKLSFQSVVGGLLVLMATLILTIVDHRTYKSNMLKLDT